MVGLKPLVKPATFSLFISYTSGASKREKSKLFRWKILGIHFGQRLRRNHSDPTQSSKPHATWCFIFVPLNILFCLSLSRVKVIVSVFYSPHSSSEMIDRSIVLVPEMANRMESSFRWVLYTKTRFFRCVCDHGSIQNGLTAKIVSLEVIDRKGFLLSSAIDRYQSDDTTFDQFEFF